jgi:hypothetical protein
MKKYPDNSQIYELKEARRLEKEKNWPAIERLRTVKRLQNMARLVPKRVEKPRDPNWSVASGRPKRKTKLA